MKNLIKITSIVLLAGISLKANAINEAPCISHTGQTVRYIQDNNLNDVAFASIAYNQPIVRYNTFILLRMTQATRYFFHQHECAHHVLAHEIGYNPNAEQQADCWAIKSLQRQGMNIRDLNMIIREIGSANSAGDATHKNSYARAQDLQMCLNNRNTNNYSNNNRNNYNNQRQRWQPVNFRQPIRQPVSQRYSNNSRFQRGRR